MTSCAACQKPLVIEVDQFNENDNVFMGETIASPSSRETVPDDVGFRCGCHFHWQCLLDGYTLAACPNCGTTLMETSPAGIEHLCCTMHNEGGLQENLDILPLLKEESYLKCYPEERKARALLEFCRQGDLSSVVDLLLDDDDEEEEEEEEGGDRQGMGDGRRNGNGNMSQRSGAKVDVLRYQDPIGGMQSALHATIMGGSHEIAWLLLLLASSLEMEQFPAQVLHEAETVGLTREDQAGKVDIRSLRDEQGRSPEQLASEMGEVWVDWIGTGRLSL